jgi:hypothetical protein
VLHVNSDHLSLTRDPSLPVTFPGKFSLALLYLYLDLDLDLDFDLDISTSTLALFSLLPPSLSLPMPCLISFVFVLG